jgi:hypothetical protein
MNHRFGSNNFQQFHRNYGLSMVRKVASLVQELVLEWVGQLVFWLETRSDSWLARAWGQSLDQASAALLAPL